MVYKGPSRGCELCRRRRVKCDEVRPGCGNCRKRKRECPGYRDLFDAIHKHENGVIVQKKPSSPKPSAGNKPDSPDGECLFPLTPQSPEITTKGEELSEEDVEMPLHLAPSRNAELEAICWFFQNYVTIPRDPTTNIFIEHILPLYLKAPAHSPLSLAIDAVALNVTQMWTSRTADSYLARQQYGRAMSLLAASLQDPVESKSDETLATVFMFDFYDSLNKRFAGYVEIGTHQRGAVALLRHRGKKNFETPTSTRLFAATRSRHINYALQHCRKVELEPYLRAEETASQPSSQLDLLNADLADLHAFAQAGYEAAGVGAIEFYQLVLATGLLLDKRLQAWRDALPKSWQPVAVPASELHPSIREAGLYMDMCDVYSSLEVSHINNAARSSHFGVLRMISLCQQELEKRGMKAFDHELQTYLDTQVQSLVDSFCASIPYHLGNRTTITFPHEHREYPPVPGELRHLASYVDAMGRPTEMTMSDHVRAAASIGGWFIMTPLLGFLNAPLLTTKRPVPGPFMSKLRVGQLKWVREQLERIQKIYLMPYNPGSCNWPGEHSSRYGYPESQDDVVQKAWTRQLWAV